MAGETKTKASGGGMLPGLVLTTLISAACGGGFAWFGVASVSSDASKPEAAAIVAKTGVPPGTQIKVLPPVLTNLASPSAAYIRLEASILVDADADTPAVMAAQTGDDFLAYLRTVTLAQVGGPSGFQFLKEDLSERARIRSGGKVRDVFFQSLVVE